jgi:hypothetical protein
MFRRLPVVIALSLGLVTAAAAESNAQDLGSWPASLQVMPHTSTFVGTKFPLLNAEQIQRAISVPDYRPAGSSKLMTSLYASTVMMQALDVHSSLSAFRSGATEANPLMQGVTRNQAMFMAVKAGVAASTILAAKQLSKRNKAAAVATLVAINSAYALVVGHNYRVAQSMK